MLPYVMNSPHVGSVHATLSHGASSDKRAIPSIASRQPRAGISERGMNGPSATATAPHIMASPPIGTANRFVSRPASEAPPNAHSEYGNVAMVAASVVAAASRIPPMLGIHLSRS